ncbi:MAG: sulfite exporter TauE/SafE family protein [Phycisphaerales bacterium]|nr:sulfite exporter TauE/SafE family protein [Phycisphaerales bacterium]
MTALIAAVFAASLLGSLHCAGMCGAFLAFAVTTDDKTDMRARARLNAAYNLGRLITYAILGAISGAVGAAVDLGGAALGVQRTAAALAGSMMIVVGMIAVARAAGFRLPHAPLPTGLRSLVSQGHRAAMNLPPISRAASIGLLTTLLPCGWLYAFAITAAGTASPIKGALTMAVFWLGTLPIMIGLGVSLQSLTGALRRRLPLVTSLLIVVVGLFTVAGRLTLPAFAAHGAADASIERVNALNNELPPCCVGKPE